jgi:hypothetical protein
MRIQGITEVLRNMPEDERDELNRVVEKLRGALESGHVQV